jgi:hypothetical protein
LGVVEVEDGNGWDWPSWEARLVRTKAQIYLAPQRRQGDKERWRQGVTENLTIVVHESLVSPLLVSLFSSLI